MWILMIMEMELIIDTEKIVSIGIRRLSKIIV